MHKPGFAPVDFDYLLHSVYTRLVPMSVRWNIGENLYNAYVGTRRRLSSARLGSAFLGEIGRAHV